MEIRVLRYFLTIAEEGSITNASRILHVTQPTLSRQIKELEEELGQKLFTRGKYNMNLTSAGELLLDRAEEIVAMVDKTKAEFYAMKMPKGRVKGDIRIGSVITEAVQSVGEAIERLSEDYPGIQYHLQSGSFQETLERLDKGELDFGIVLWNVSLFGYESICLPEKSVCGVLMRADCPLAARASLKKEDLWNLPLILPQKYTLWGKWGKEIEDWFTGEYDKMNVVMTYNLIYQAAKMAELGLGYTVGPNLEHILESDTLCFRPFNPPMESDFHLVWKKSRLLSPAAELFLEKVKEVGMNGS